MLRPVLILSGLALAAPAVAAQAKAPTRDAPVLACHDRISGAVVRRGDETTPFRFAVHAQHDTTFGAIAFSGLADYGRPAQWREMVRRDQWLKSIALVRPGSRVTLVVPTPQRAWMRMRYVHGQARAAHEVTLEGCRRLASRTQQREECGPGPQDTCTSGRTPFSGGFEIDYARAPRQGRCAQLIVWTQGERRPQLKRLFRPGLGECP